MLLLFAAVISITADFEGGSLGRVENVGPHQYRAHVLGQVDQNGRNRQASWYYFRVDHAKDRTLTFDMVDLPGEYNYRPNKGAITQDTPPFYSYDQVTWHPVEDAVFDAAEPKLRFRIASKSDRLWIAHVPPYTNSTFANLVRDVSKSPHVRRTSVGRSVEGREIPLLTITDTSYPDDGKKVIWLMFRQHAWEAGSSWTGEGLIRSVTSGDPLAARIRRETILKILPLCDPDGVAHGGVRFNRHGYDLNRNWDLVDPVKMPEIAAERHAILDWVDAGKRVDFFLTVHNTETNEYLNGPPDVSGALKPLLDGVFRVWSEGKTFSAAQAPVFAQASTTAGKPGRMNVIQGLYHDRKLPAFEVEMRIA
ncbi:MAG TPA: M14-type cytosolic carboxypeptidase, partial [Bryobacteraceae bacterium]|nr:M14-type cytosolic carboxypeptidase [Bryobacteraceae bacterium]